MALAYWAATGVLGIACIFIAIRSSAAVNKFEVAKSKLEARIKTLEEEMSALMDGTFGMGDQLEQVKMDLKIAIEKQQQLDQRDLDSLPYNQAVRMAGQGASVDELVQQCGLSRAEAELVLLLHKQSPPVVTIEVHEKEPDSIEVVET